MVLTVYQFLNPCGVWSDGGGLTHMHWSSHPDLVSSHWKETIDAFGASDALFNLGCAFAAVQALWQGVYIKMNGKVFPRDNVWKNNKLGKFKVLTD